MIIPASVQSLLLSIPESVGILAFGLGLVATAVSIRWFLARSEKETTE